MSIGRNKASDCSHPEAALHGGHNVFLWAQIGVDQHSTTFGFRLEQADVTGLVEADRGSIKRPNGRGGGPEMWIRTPGDSVVDHLRH